MNKEKLITIRLDDLTRDNLNSLKKHLGLNKSQSIRQSIRVLYELNNISKKYQSDIIIKTEDGEKKIIL